MASVRIYVIKPASYNFCAADIVRFDEKYNLRAASCCNVLVVNGAAECLVTFLRSMLTTVAEITGLPIFDKMSSTIDLFSMLVLSIFLPSNFVNAD